MKKYSGVVLHVIIFVFLFIFLRIFSEYHFYRVEQNQLFQLTPIFIIDKLMQPGGLAMVLSGCLVQLFILPNVGAMITAALLTNLRALFWAVLKRINPRSHGILRAWFPVLSLLFVQWDFNYRFQGTVAFDMMLFALHLVLGIRNFVPRLIASLSASLLLFGLAGSVSLLFVLSMVGYKAMSRTPRWYYSAILPMIVLILDGLCVRYSVIGEYRFVFLPDGYYYFRLVPDRVVYLSWIAFYTALVITCPCKNRESWAGKKCLALRISQFIILELIFWKGFDLYGEQKSYRLKMMDYFTRTE